MSARMLLSFLLFALYFPMVAQTYEIEGELRKWHKITITFNGPNTSETASPNPFMDYRLNVTFTNGNTVYTVPGYYAADGEAGETSSTSGNKWRVHFAPDKTGTWDFTASFRKGTNVAVSDSPTAGQATSFNGASGSFAVANSDKTGRDHRGKGRLKYIGKRYLQFAETGEYFIKTGVDSPENFLAYDNFDNTPNYNDYRKSWAPHEQDWNAGDPTWKGGKGKGIIGALNYLSEEGQNAFSTLTMNINGDDRNIYPYLSSNAGDRKRFDCSKLDQWEVVFEHADHKGLFIHFKTSETENCFLLDGGDMGPERKIYYRELIARFGHHLALNWNLGEENKQTTAQRIAMTQYFFKHDPYNHLVVVHNGHPFTDLLGSTSKLTGASVQSMWNQVHGNIRHWIKASENSGKNWVVSSDEQGPANVGVPTDPGYPGNQSQDYTQDDIRKTVLWGSLMAGGSGVEYYFGYQLPQSDIRCQDYRSRDRMWEYNRHAHAFFTNYVNVINLENRNNLIGNNSNDNSKYCFAKRGETYVVYLPKGGTTTLDLENYNINFKVRWYNPRAGGSLKLGSVSSVDGGGQVSIGTPPNDTNKDWVALVTINSISCPVAGTACNDGDPNTIDDEEDGNCNCVGTPCPTAGTTCDDGNPDTTNDVEDGSCNCSGVILGGDTDIWLEAECADIGNKWSIESDNNASGDKYLLPPDAIYTSNPPPTTADMVTFNFTVGQSGNYKVFGRVMAISDAYDSFWVRANNGTWQKWNKINADNYGNTYQWEQVGHWTGGDSSTPVTFSLNAGANVIQVAAREPNTRLDKLFVSLNTGMPSGIGYEDPAGCFGLCPPAGTACDDGDALTENDVEDGSCNCSGTPISTCPPAGTACDDGDPSTTNDVEDGNCGCVGTPCPTAGTVCNDGDPTTFNDEEDGNCNCAGTPCPTAGTACNDGDPTTFDDEEDGNCNCAGTPCPTAGTACNDGDPTTFNDEEDGNCNCAGTPCPTAGTACNDNDPTTFDDEEDGNCNCAGTPCPTAGTACDDGDPDTFNDVADGNCGCAGTPPNCPDAGTPCNDNDPSTFDDEEDGNCNCAGTPCPTAGTACDDGDPTTFDDEEDGNCNCAGTPCPIAGTACNDNDPTTFDDEEDGNCNCAGTPCPTAGTACNDNDPTTFDDEEDGNCNCAGTPCPTAGTTCDDGDPDTINDVEDGNCNCAGVDPITNSGTDVWLEAECANVGSKWSILTDDAASGDQYALPPNSRLTSFPSPNLADWVSFDFSVSEAGNYRVFGRTMTSGNSNDSYWVRANGGTWQRWNKINAGNYGSLYHWEQVGHWTPGQSDNTPVFFTLNAGDNTIDIAAREPGARLDKLFVSKSGGIPDGIGYENPNGNCDTTCPTAGTACDDGDPSTINDIEDGNCNCAGEEPDVSATTDVWLEAECAEVGSNWSILSSTTASNDAYIKPPNRWNNPAPSGQTEDQVRFVFSVPTAGAYKVFARSIITGTNSDSYWVRANGGNWVQWNSISFNDYSNNFQWEQVSDAQNGNALVTFTLNAGTNILEFSNREPQVMLDKIFVTLHGSKPTSMGVEGDCGDDTPCPAAGSSCDDGDPSTENDVADGNCNCSGTPCPVAGTACNDGDPTTENDVADGNCGCAGEVPTNADVLWLEAECAELGSAWTIHDHGDAANDQYILPPTTTQLASAPDDEADLVTFTFDLATSGTYQVYGRTWTTGDKRDSYWVRVNNGPWKNWNRINVGNYGNFFQWEQVSHWLGGSNSVPLTFDLTRGINTIQFSWREPNARLDKLFITKANDAPQGEGEVATNCDNSQASGRDETAWENSIADKAFAEKPALGSTPTEQTNHRYVQTIHMYPNPAETELFVEWELPIEDQGSISILDINGKRLTVQELTVGTVTQRLDVSRLHTGMYILALQTDQAAPVIRKFTVQ